MSTGPGQPESRPPDAPTFSASDDSTIAPEPTVVGETRKVLRENAIPGYQLRQLIDAGGQGEVYEALQISIGKRRAIKVLRRSTDDAETLTRFEREVEILASLNHPNIVTIIDKGEVDGRKFYVMEYVSGDTFKDWVAEQRERLSRRLGTSQGPSATSQTRGDPRQFGQQYLDEVLQVFIRICEAVDAAHQRGIVHRDLKPANIRIDENGEPHILDFGLAKSLASDHDVTMAGTFRGTIAWTSPEQIEGRTAIDQRSDVYSLGVILYHALCGSFPYAVEGLQAAESICYAPPEPPSKRMRGIPADLETIILKCLLKERRGRYENAGELAGDLERFRQGQNIQARRESPLYVLVGHLRQLARRQAVAAQLVGLLIVLFLVYRFGDSLMFVWTPVDDWYHAGLIAAGGPAPNPLSNVRLITMRDTDKIHAAAKQAGLAEVDWYEDKQSLRRSHAFLLQRLMRCSPLAVAFDLWFTKPSPYDEEFGAAIEAALNQPKPLGVAVGTHDWNLDADGLPGLTPRLRAARVNWGCVDISWSAARNSVELFMRRSELDVRPSFALAMLAAVQRPGVHFDIALPSESINKLKNRFQFTFYHADPLLPGRRAKPELSPPIDYTATQIMTAEDISRLTQSQEDAARVNQSIGIEPNDVIGYYALETPRLADCVGNELAYDDALVMPEADLRKACMGRVVIIADFRPGMDSEFPGLNHERLKGGMLQGTAIDQLLRSGRIWTLGWSYHILTLCGTVLGLLLGVGAAWRTWVRWGLYVALAALAVGGSVLAFRSSSLVFDPAVPLLGTALMMELSALLERIRTASRG